MTNREATSLTVVDSQTSSPLLEKKTRSIAAVLTFLAFAFAWSWAAGAGATQVKADSPLLSTILIVLAGFGPSLAGLGVVFAFSTRKGRRDWLVRSLNWHIGWRWFAFAFAFPPLVMLIAISVHMLSGGQNPVSLTAHQIPLIILNFALVLMVGGPLGEELGWRGYLTPALRSNLGWRSASLIVGLVWGAWHLPLFFVAETPQSNIPIPMFLLNILAGAVVFGWLFEKTQGSVLPAIVLHTSLNGWAGVLGIVSNPESGKLYTLVTGFLVLVALALLTSTDRSASERISIAAKRSSVC